MLLQISKEFKAQIMTGYVTDRYWEQILQQLKDNTKLGPNAAQLPYELEDGLIYCTIFGLSTVRCLCVP